MSPYVIPLGHGDPNGYYMGSIGYYNKCNGPYMGSIMFTIIIKKSMGHYIIH